MTNADDHRVLSLTDNQIRFALAGHAYANGTIRIAERDLAGYSHLVTTRHGLFAANREGLRLLVRGLFFGITILGDDIFAFESCDRPAYRTVRGRIIRFRRDGDRLVDEQVLAIGLDNGCHQIDVIGDRLCVLDTYNQSILLYPLAGGEPDIVRPIPGNGKSGWDGGYVHINAVIADGDDILLMLHNGAEQSGRPSEIARLDRQWRLVERRPIDGMGCHSLAVLEDRSILFCGSFAGEIVSTGGLKIPVCDLMTRGLSVGDDGIVVGASCFAAREVRDEVRGALFFLDRDYRQLARVTVPAPPMDIRRIDGRDRSLSPYLAGLARPDGSVGNDTAEALRLRSSAACRAGASDRK